MTRLRVASHRAKRKDDIKKLKRVNQYIQLRVPKHKLSVKAIVNQDSTDQPQI